MKIKYKRLVAYIIDIILVSFVIGLICNSNLMQKQMDKYNDAKTRLEEKTASILNDEDNEKENVEELKSIIYDINYFGLTYNVVNILITIGYFAIFQYFNKGKTIGKKILKIKVVSSYDTELPLANFLLRTIILYNIIFTVINIVSIEFLKINGFYKVYVISSSLSSVVTIILLFMILFKKDEKGLHDVICSSKVIEE